MNKYDLIAKVAKYTTIVASIYMVGHFGINVYFDNNKKSSVTNVTNNYSE